MTSSKDSKVGWVTKVCTLHRRQRRAIAQDKSLSLRPPGLKSILIGSYEGSAVHHYVAAANLVCD